MDRLPPLLLEPNRPVPRPYRGGGGIERFRRMPASGDEWAPEDFLASTVATFGSTVEGPPTMYRNGLSLVNGNLLREEIAADPVGYLGPDHASAYGANTLLLCKLLYTAERLFVHVHPDEDFAGRELCVDTGKTEAWIVLDTESAASRTVWVGFHDDVSEEDLARWFHEQDSDALLGAMNAITVEAGDTVFVPAGLPHAIGSGILILELQEPADLSIILEYEPFERLEKTDSLLGLEEGIALEAVDRHGIAGQRLAGLISRSAGPSRGSLLPRASERFFRAEQISAAAGSVRFEAQYAVLVIIAGSGRLTWQEGSQAVMAGDAILVPFGAGETRLEGVVTAVRCMPPAVPATVGRTG